MRLCHVDDEVFRHLSTLPDLRALHGIFTLSDAISLQEGSFPALETFKMTDMSDHTVNRCPLLLVLSKSLTVLGLNISVPLTDKLPEYLDKTMRTIRAMVFLRKLQFSVDVKMGPERLDSKGQSFKGVVFGDVLRRLNCLSRLQDVNFGVEFDFLTITNFDVNDADMETIATAW